MGLLDEFSDFAKTPQGQGLLSAAFGGLAGARRGAPLNSIGNAGLAGLQGYSNGLERDQQAQQFAQQQKAQGLTMQAQQLQIDKANREAEQEKKMQGLLGNFSIPAKPASVGGLDQSLLPADLQTGVPVTPMAAQPASFDRQGYGMALEGINPQAGFNYLQGIKKDNTPITVKEGETLLDKNTFKPIFANVKPVDLPSAVKEYNFAVSQGETKPFTQWMTDQKKAGAANVSTKIENKMGDSLAGQVGPMVKDTYTAANGAVQQVDAANRIIKAVQSGKIIAGPLAGARLQASQLGQLLGVTGKDEADTIARSRDVIRGLAEMTLQGRKQMSGQGAITESEGALAEKANSGNIGDLTPAEIVQLAKASARASRFVYGQHQQNLDNLNTNPSTQGLAKFYKPMQMPADIADAPAPAAPPNVGALVDKYRSR